MPQLLYAQCNWLSDLRQRGYTPRVGGVFRKTNLFLTEFLKGIAMCIIVISETKPLTLASFVDFHKSNPDGAGIMTAHDGKVHVHVSLDGPEAMYTKYMQMYKPDTAMFLHYRMQTHGKVDLANTHPYLVYRWENGKELWMMHNGILKTGNAANKDMSDTWHYIQDYMQELSRDFPKWFLNEAILCWIGESIGNNRFVLLDSDGDYGIVNYTQWSEHDEHLYSNNYAWSSPRKALPKYPTRVYGGYYGDYNSDDWWDRNNTASTVGATPVGKQAAQSNILPLPTMRQVPREPVVPQTEEDKIATYEMYQNYADALNMALPVGVVGTFSVTSTIRLQEYEDLDSVLEDIKTNPMYTVEALTRLLFLLTDAPDNDDTTDEVLDILAGIETHSAEFDSMFFEQFDEQGFDSEGYDESGYDRNGVDRAGLNVYGYPVGAIMTH